MNNSEINYDKIFEKYGKPDSRGFIMIPDLIPTEVEDDIKNLTGLSSKQLRLKIISCDYADGTVIKIC